jgi:hypothetical protein
MDVFIVLIEDRHSDPSVEVFRDVTVLSTEQKPLFVNTQGIPKTSKKV